MDLNYYEKLSEQGKKRVDSYAKFILDEENYSDDIREISGLILDLKKSPLWSQVELGNIGLKEVRQASSTLESYLENLDYNNSYRKNIENIIGDCNRFLQGEQGSSSAIIAQLKELEYNLEN